MNQQPRLASVPAFTVGGVEWRCWIVEVHGHERFEWRSDDGTCAVWRDGAMFWAAINGRLAGRSHPTLRAAMVHALETRRIAA